MWNPSGRGGHRSLAAVRLGGGTGASASPPAQFAVVDANANVSLLLNGASGAASAGGGAPEMSAVYEYGPFGEPLRATGPLAKANPVRFSSELLDTATGCYYYGYRYYHPDTGRWLSRDPIGELGGVNLYAFTKNAPLNLVDLFGLLVVGAFDIETGTLTMTDSDTGETIVLCGESGGKPFGDPIPTGEWEILDHPDNNFFRLDAVDDAPRNDIHEPTKRSHFRLHKPGRTTGCIAAKAECGDCWRSVVDMIRNTKAEDVQVTSQRRWPLGPVTETIKKFGDFRIINTSGSSGSRANVNRCECVCNDKN